jgi:hypothetical protein
MIELEINYAGNTFLKLSYVRFMCNLETKFCDVIQYVGFDLDGS